MDNRTLSKRYGIIAENLFINKCMLNGYSVFKNQNDIGEIDFLVIVDNSILRFQVKSTIESSKRETHYVSTKRNGNKLYTNIDYIACYLHEIDEWYIIPFKLLNNKQAITITINDNKYIDFKENWKFNINKTDIEIDDRNIDNRNKAIELFKSGKSKTEIARSIKVHYSVINRWLRESGFGIRKLDETKDNLVALYDSNLTMKEIAIKLNMSVWTIRNLFRKYSIQVKRNTNPNGKKGNK
jgi:transposase